MRHPLLGLCLCLLLSCVAPVPDSAPQLALRPEQVPLLQARPDPLLPLGNRSPYRVGGVEYEVLATAQQYHERGIASWYGRKFHGKQTANGEIFDMYRISAAHRSLPIPSYLQVTNLDNGRQLLVRVNDRGPFHPERIIDLSYAAAVKLGFTEQGTARVKLQHVAVAGVEDRRASPAGNYRFLQMGAFASQPAAEGLQRQLRAEVTLPVFVSSLALSQGMRHRVRIGPIDDAVELLALRRQLELRGYGPIRPMP